MELNEQLEAYIEAHTTPEDPLLHELDRETHLRVLKPRMCSGHVQGAILTMLARMIRPQTILEIGTFTGYSAICLARGLAPDGVLHTFEVDDELESIAARYIERSDVADRIVRHVADVRTEVLSLGTTFDLAFVDGDKREYLEYYNLLMDNNLVPSGGYIFADNTIWYEKILHPVKHGNRHTETIVAFNDFVQNDPRVENLILPFRDGMSIIRVK